MCIRDRIGTDPDIVDGPIAFVPDVAAQRSGIAAWLTRRQGWFFFPLLTLEGAALHVASIQGLASTALVPHRLLELSLVVVRLGLATVLPFVVMTTPQAVVFVLLQMAVFGVLLGGAFAPNHKGMPLVPKDVRVDFLRRQVLMSRNIRGGWIIDFMMGGLNYQIEHHLFPSMPRANLAKVRPLVQAPVSYTHLTLPTM